MRNVGLVWTREAIVAAGQAWHEKHGKPPTAADWRKATPQHPSDTVVRVRFERWNAFLEAAGWDPRPTHRTCAWSQAEILHAVFVWRAEYGRTPRWRDWAIRTDARWPSTATVQSVFRTWNEMLEAGGYTLNQRTAAPIVEKREKARAYKREWMRKRRAAARVAVLCAECNTERLVRAEYAQRAAEQSCRACTGSKAGRAWVAERERRCAQKIDRLPPPAIASEPAEVLEINVQKSPRSSRGRTEAASFAATIDLTDQGVAA